MEYAKYHVAQIKWLYKIHVLFVQEELYIILSSSNVYALIINIWTIWDFVIVLIPCAHQELIRKEPHVLHVLKDVYNVAVLTFAHNVKEMVLRLSVVFVSPNVEMELW